VIFIKEFDNIITEDSFIISIRFNRQSKKFILQQKLVINIDKVYRLIINSVKKLNNHDINIDIKELKGKLQGLYRIRKGDLRIIFRYYKGEIHIVNIEKIDFRGDVY